MTKTKAIYASQRRQILQRLKRGYTLTPIQALDYYGSMRLGARIKELRDQGYDISTTMIKIKGTDGAVKRVAKYRMESI